MGVEPRTLALLAPRSKPTELIDRSMCVKQVFLNISATEHAVALQK
jgi:hypothetical protein